ncbi:uncharacterized protein TRIVIDRAFT_48085 [Trichoderma virens Gv29-8]|uniref:Uncharacterized protein n=1 Tax=Hypocrea virens (strain Gv29-8 / FGSC 10586) TaxID=413071 RepID=G9MZG0_HYPVG|nr:uncharacterized protein TRIVIDRAFT_48085 [Trichoderma virens Gv29-8]EHK20017.1 hypothetical protein TRIVIDRAFT_48085 [Trichoderma virens Gv29-8]UKZ46038.1 hypothetical protein TrVGV298_000235 [Trichoderma virens]
MPLSNKKHNAALAAEQQNLAASGAAGGASANANLPGPAPFTAGPHRHDIMNKLDPTVDSGTGGMQVLTSGGHTNTAAAGVPGQPLGQAPAAGGVMGSNNPYGVQHNSRMANALDPRVDFIQGQPGGANYYTKGTNVMPGAAAAPRHVPEGTYGPHNSRLANAADPRIDSDADRHRVGGVGAGAGAGTGAGTASRPIYPPGVAGPAPTTAGPHRHDILNKLDPSVDSRSATNVDATGRRLV